MKVSSLFVVVNILAVVAVASASASAYANPKLEIRCKDGRAYTVNKLVIVPAVQAYSAYPKMEVTIQGAPSGSQSGFTNISNYIGQQYTNPCEVVAVDK